MTIWNDETELTKDFIIDTELSVRAQRTLLCLYEIKTIGDLKACTENHFLRIPNTGQKTLKEISLFFGLSNKTRIEYKRRKLLNDYIDSSSLNENTYKLLKEHLGADIESFMFGFIDFTSKNH